MSAREIRFFFHPSCEIDRSISSLPEECRPTVRTISSIRDILDDPVFEKNASSVDVWTDFDGVLNHLFQRDNDPYKWVFFRRIARHARSIHIVSMRVPVSGDAGVFPFFPHGLRERIRRPLLKANPDCRVEFHLGFGKVFDQRSFAKFSAMVSDSLDSHIPVLLIGSSVFDRFRFKKLINGFLSNGKTDLSLLKYFDTGRLFI